MCCVGPSCVFFFFKQKTAYEMRISDWSSDVCSSDLAGWNDFTDGYAAIERRDLPAAQKSLSAISALHAASQAARDTQTSSYLAILEDDLGGLLAIKQGKLDSGVETKIGSASCRERVCRYV